jgi:hypothetical protein
MKKTMAETSMAFFNISKHAIRDETSFPVWLRIEIMLITAGSNSVPM